jgi:hypothetical protein
MLGLIEPIFWSNMTPKGFSYGLRSAPLAPRACGALRSGLQGAALVNEKREKRNQLRAGAGVAPFEPHYANRDYLGLYPKGQQASDVKR